MKFTVNNDFFFDNKTFSPGRPLIIAELGTSHNADLQKARDMIEAVKQAGADCVKFQMVFADEILHPNTGEVALPSGKIRLYDRFKTLEMKPEFYLSLKEFAESKGLLFLCTPFGLKSARILRDLKPQMLKIASPELNFTALLEEIALYRLPVLLSCGVSRLADIDEAVSILKPHTKLCLLHCVTSYPAPETEYNLRILNSLAMIFGVPVGVSDHSLDPQLVPGLAISMGASVIEKHFCLSRDDPGLDDPIALPPDQFGQMVQTIQSAAAAGPEKTLELFCAQHGEKLVERVLGSGVKELAPCEEANYHRTNRSIHALRDIEPGQIIQKTDYAVLRTEKILRPGMEPRWEPFLAGKTARNFIPAGEGIRFQDI